MACVTYRFHWRGVEVEAEIDLNTSEISANIEMNSVSDLCRLAKARHDETETPSPRALEPDAEIIAAVTAWLDATAASPDWQSAIETSRQGELF